MHSVKSGVQFFSCFSLYLSVIWSWSLLSRNSCDIVNRSIYFAVQQTSRILSVCGCVTWTLLLIQFRVRGVNRVEDLSSQNATLISFNIDGEFAIVRASFLFFVPFFYVNSDPILILHFSGSSRNIVNRTEPNRSILFADRWWTSIHVSMFAGLARIVVQKFPECLRQGAACKKNHTR